MLDEEYSQGNATSLVAKWADLIFGDDEEWQQMVAGDDFEDEIEFDVNGTLANWVEPLVELVGRSTNLNLSPGDILDIDELPARTTLFPLLLCGLAGRQGNIELLVVYLFSRLLGRLNVQALARYEGRDLGSRTPDEIVADLEATYVRKSQQEVFNQFGLAFGLTCLFAWHSVSPWMPLMKDPGIRLTEGEVLAAQVRQWVVPEGVNPDQWDGAGALPVMTERYQEAALLSFYLPISAAKAPGCGRYDEYDRLAQPLPPKALFVRPSTSGYEACLDQHYVSRTSPSRTQGVDSANRLVGRWDIIEYDEHVR